MTRTAITPTDRERTFGENEIIVSKTDPKGRITYANSIFLDISSYEEKEVLGQPHSLIRHPDMPRCIFQLLWDRVTSGQEIFAYVKNMAKNGDFYWVFAHVTPSVGANGQIVGYHSNRRLPDADSIAKIVPIYRQLRAAEDRHDDRKEGQKAGHDVLTGMLADAGVDYDQFVFSL